MHNGMQNGRPKLKEDPRKWGCVNVICTSWASQAEVRSPVPASLPCSPGGQKEDGQSHTALDTQLVPEC